MNCVIYELTGRHSYFCKNADFRLFDNPVRMDRKCLLRGYNPRKDRGIFQNGVSVALDGVLVLPCFFKEGRSYEQKNRSH
jgi:hypothetical protein